MRRAVIICESGAELDIWWQERPFSSDAINCILTPCRRVDRSSAKDFLISRLETPDLTTIDFGYGRRNEVSQVIEASPAGTRLIRR